MILKQRASLRLKMVNHLKKKFPGFDGDSLLSYKIHRVI